jgi:hypothetical protein
MVGTAAEFPREHGHGPVGLKGDQWSDMALEQLKPGTLSLTGVPIYPTMMFS